MNNTIMEKNFELFLSQLAETNATLESYCDFTKIKKNVHNIEISLNMLNFLLGKEDLRPAVELLWERDKSVFNVLDILIATRRKEKKKFIDTDGQIKIISSLFKSVDGIMQFLNETGLSEVFRNKDIKNLVDYVFGVETGLDTHARKNRGGDITETLLHNILIQNGIPHKTEVYSSYYSQIQTALGDDKKRFDFVIETNKKTYLIEVNFYNGGGSKLNEVARAYRELAPLINNIKGFEFVWITDGKGWIGAKNKLSEAYNDIPKVYNFSTLKIFLEEIKSELNG